jgi:thymidylate synthase
VISKLTNLQPRYFNLSLGDSHIYSDHEDAVLEQLSRKPFIFPNIEIPDIKTLEDVEKLTYEDFKIYDYIHYPSIKANMVA